MKATGVVRKFDENGRFVIPMELRKMLGLTDREDALEVFVDGNNIILKKYEPSCTFCNSMDTLIEYKDKKICKKCIEKLNVLIEE